MTRILVVRFSSLGDVVLTTVLLDALHARHPDAEIWWLTKEAFAPLLAEDPRVHRVVSLRPGRPLASVAAELEGVVFDLLLDAHGSLRSRLLPWLLPPGQWRRLRKDTAARLWLLATRRRTRPLERRMVDRLLALVGPGPHDARPRIVVPDPLRSSAQRAGRWIAVAPAARHAPKQWPVERFAALVRRFQTEVDGGVLVLAGPGEERIAATVAEALHGPHEVMAGHQPLLELAAALEGCELLVCNDSGLMHLAEAVGTPVVALFGPTTRDWGYFPLDARSVVLEHEVDCRPCSRNGARACHRPERYCMTGIEVDSVHAAVLRTLEQE